MNIKSFSLSIALYILWSIIVIMRISLGSFEVLGLALVMILVALVIKDVLLYGVEVKPSKIKSYHIPSSLPLTERYLLRNRLFIFPTILTIYLIYLLIKQTQLWNLHTSMVFGIIEENMLLVAVILSGIATIFKEDLDKKYEVVKKSLKHTYIYIGFSIVLSLLTVYIVLTQVATLGWIGYVISGIAGVLLFLIGLMIVLQEDTVTEDDAQDELK